MPDLLCPEDHELLPLLADESAHAPVREHLAGCSSCRQRLERLQAEVANLRQAVAWLTPSGFFSPAPPRVSERGAGQENGLPATVPGPPAAALARKEQGVSAERGDRPNAIGKYLILDVLDGGGQATVYRAFHPTLAREVVLKLTRRPFDTQQADRDYFVSEGKILADLEHPNLARVYDLDFHEGRPFLVMEYVRGRNLHQVARQHPLRPRQAAHLVAKVARALAVAHRRGFLHQDIKPQNILIDEAGQPRLIDFGLARLRDAWKADVDNTGRISGTPAFMAPEQARGDEAQISARSDLFALGAVLYALLVGQAPYAGKTDYDTLAQAGRCDFDRTALRTKGVPRRLQAICLRAMAADPADRYSTAEDLAADLEQFVRRPRVLLACAIATTLAFLVIGGAWLLRTRMATDLSASRRVDILVGQARWKSDLPLRSGDRLTIRCPLPQGHRPATMFWFDTEGRLEEVTPTEDSGTELAYPQKGHTVRLQGPPGTDIVFVCASRPGFVLSGASLAKHFPEGRPWPALPAHTMVLLDREKVEVSGDRGLGKVEADPVHEVRVRLEQLRRDLHDQSEFLAGVAVPHQ